MRLILSLCCLCLLATPVLAQTAAPPAAAPDWRSFGRPLDDDSKAMRDRLVYLENDTLDRTVGNDRAVLSQEDLFDWLREKLAVILTLEGTKYDGQVKANSVLFTAKGYADYTGYLNDIGLGRFLTGNQFKTVAYMDGQPFLTNQGVVETPASVAEDGRQVPASRVYTWQVTARVVLSYLDYRNQPPAMLFKGQMPSEIRNRFPLQVTVDVTRITQKAEGDPLVAINAIAFETVK